VGNTVCFNRKTTYPRQTVLVVRALLHNRADLSLQRRDAEVMM
jgi:hypothetical protein